MPPVEQIVIFLASPGDVARERRYINQVVDEINHSTGYLRGITLHVIQWDKDTFPAYGNDAQSLVNAQIAEMQKYDLFVGIMWNRLGTPTPRADSGTVEEFERAAQSLKRAGRPEIWFYFRRSPSTLDTEDQIDQRKKVVAFKRKVRSKGLPFDYESPASLREMFRNHLLRWLETRLGATRSSDGQSTSAAPGAKSAQRGRRRQTAAATAVEPAGASRSRTTSASKASAGKAKPKTAALRVSGKAIADSGAWMLLGEDFFLTSSVSHRADGTIVVAIPEKSPEEAAAFRRLRPGQFGSTRSIAFAHRNEATIVAVESVESESVKGKTVHTVRLRPDTRATASSSFTDMGINDYSADDIAQMRARLLLLNEEPGDVRKHDLEWILHVTPDNERTGEARQGVLVTLWQRSVGARRNFLIQARLLAVYRLKLTNIVEDILELKLGPVSRGKVPVRFRGRRRRAYDSQPPAVIQVTGTCQLNALPG